MDPSSHQLDYGTTPPPAGITWERRPDGLFIQIPPAPRERLLARIDRSVFRRFMLFAFIGIVAGFGYSEGMPGEAALVGFVVCLILAALLWRSFMKRSALIRVAHLPTTLEISQGNLSIDAPHTGFNL